MSSPGSRKIGQDLAPFYILKVEGTELELDITKWVEMVEFESALDMSDLLKITVVNPGFMFEKGMPDFTTHKVFQPGNQIDVWAGYGSKANAVYLGRGIVDRHEATFPEASMPILEVKCYDASKLMMQQSSDTTVSLRPKRDTTKTDAIGKAFLKKSHYEMVLDKANKYGFGADVQPTNKIDTIVQKKDMTDYQFVKGLAALNSMDFWIDYDIIVGEWTLHWKPEEKNERPIYKLGYGTSIFSCTADLGLREQITDLQVMYFSEKKQEWVSVDKAITEPGPDMIYRKSTTPSASGSPRKRNPKGRKPVKRATSEQNLVNEEIKSVERLRLAAAGHSIDIIPNRKFKDANDAAAFALRWLKGRKDHFIILKGEMIGVEDMKARQVHEITGLGTRLNGYYRFTSVRHKLGGSQQYRIEFQANKILE
jgi:phage protein D